MAFPKWQMGLVFEKGEPADITYCVEVFPKGSEMDLKPEEQAEEYADYCSVAGWELIDGQRKFCIFRRRDPDAMPIVTEEERFENVRKAERRELLWDMLVPVLLTAQFWCRALGRNLRTGSSLRHICGSFLWQRCFWQSVSCSAAAQFCGRSGKTGAPGGKAGFVWKTAISQDYGMDPCDPAGNRSGGSACIDQHAESRSGSCRIHICYPDFTAAILWFRPSRGTNWWLQIGGGIGLAFFLIIVSVAVVFTENGTAENQKALAQLPLTQENFREMSGSLTMRNMFQRNQSLGAG